MEKKAVGYSVTGGDLMRLGIPLKAYSELEPGDPVRTSAILYEAEKGVGHWVLVVVKPAGTRGGGPRGRLEWFDSYGFDVDEEEKNGAELSAAQGPVLSGMVDDWQRRTGGEVVINARQLQATKEDDNTCGRWVIARYFARDTPLEEWLERYPGPPTKNDLAVVLDTLPLLRR
jgi:hypothetical protein